MHSIPKAQHPRVELPPGFDPGRRWTFVETGKVRPLSCTIFLYSAARFVRAKRRKFQIPRGMPRGLVNPMAYLRQSHEEEEPEEEEVSTTVNFLSLL